VVAVDETIDTYRNDPAYRGLASYDPLSPEERAFHTSFDIQKRHDLSEPNADSAAWYATHQAGLARIAALDKRGPAIELFLATT
jgi:hypothetical protein